MITRNANSKTARLYRWYYNLYSEKQMPQSLCPYFWKLVLMWVTILPLTIITLPGQLWGSFDRDSWGRRLGASFIIYIFIFALSCMGVAITLFFTHYEKGDVMITFAAGGILFWGIAIIVSVIQLVKFIIEGIRIKTNVYRKPKEKKPSLLLEFIKAKYNKYCPKIDWK